MYDPAEQAEQPVQVEQAEQPVHWAVTRRRQLTKARKFKDESEQWIADVIQNTEALRRDEKFELGRLALENAERYFLRGASGRICSVYIKHPPEDGDDISTVSDLIAGQFWKEIWFLAGDEWGKHVGAALRKAARMYQYVDAVRYRGQYAQPPGGPAFEHHDIDVMTRR